MATASAPGKIILFGEHSVVYGRPALAVPVTQVQATVNVIASSRPGIWIDAPDISLSSDLNSLSPDHPLAAVVREVFSSLGTSQDLPITVHISSTIPVAAGLGSGAAVSVAIIRALSAFLGKSLPKEEISALAYEVEKLHHGTPSGIDNSVITYVRPVYFIMGQPIETFHVGSPFTIVVGDTGIIAPTKESVGDVRRLWQAEPARWENVFDKVAEIVLKARQAIEIGNISTLGPLMDANHALLKQLTVSSPELDRLVEAARQSGALGAKLSGGGRGGNMIALADEVTAPLIAKALLSQGAKRALITVVTG